MWYEWVQHPNHEKLKSFDKGQMYDEADLSKCIYLLQTRDQPICFFQACN